MYSQKNARSLGGGCGRCEVRKDYSLLRDS